MTRGSIFIYVRFQDNPNSTNLEIPVDLTDYCSTPDNNLTIIKYDGLALGDSFLGLVKDHFHSVGTIIFNGRPLFLMIIADFGFQTQRLGDFVYRDQIDSIVATDIQTFNVSCDNLVFIRKDFGDELLFIACEIQSFALSDGVVNDSLMGSNHGAVFINDLATRVFFIGVFLDEFGIISVLNKANILTFLF